jgi:hypothetical protein
MFDSFKSVKVFCRNEQELSNLIRWLCKGHLSLNDAARGTYSVDVVLPNLEGMATGEGIRGYYVSIPLDEVKPRMKKLSIQEVFADILNP